MDFKQAFIIGTIVTLGVFLGIVIADKYQQKELAKKASTT